jgi:hypothetical protein
MKLFTEEQYEAAKFRDFLLVKCDICGKDYLRTKRSVHVFIKRRFIKDYCCMKCQKVSQSKTLPKECANCGKQIMVKSGIVKRREKSSQSNKFFCNHSCSAVYYNKHKIKGIRRSKLEIFLESKIKEEFPNLKMLPNDVTAINYELDFYFPTINFGIEINGIVHYEPIYGDKKFERTQYNDKQKILLCAEKGIELCIIPNIFDRFNDKIVNMVWEDLKPIIHTIISRR